MQKPIILTDDVEITYNKGKSNEFKALKKARAEIFPYEYIILFGPSGCGKSTLLYSIFGVLPPSLGKVYVKGESIYDFSPKQMNKYQRKTMGIMYQQFNLINSISVLDNVALPQIFMGVPPSKRERRAMQLLKRFGIDHVAHKRPTLLSGGQQQRVSVARSLVNDPEILIADEPVGNLDSKSSKAVMDTLDGINEFDKKTIILVTHDAKHLPYAHRVYYMKDGGVQRIVPNPQKKQIKKIEPGETIITEIEQVSRIFPYASPTEVRVKSIINYLTQDISFDQLESLEHFLGLALEGKMSQQNFFESLMKPQNHGGMGLKEWPAQETSSKLYRLLEQARDVSRYRKLKMKGVTFTPHHILVQNIRDYVSKELTLDLSDEQKINFDKSVAARISGFIKKDDFKEQLGEKIADGGVQLEKVVVHDLTRYLEKLIALGVSSTAGE